MALSRALAPNVDELIIVARRRERLDMIARDLQSAFPALKIGIHAIDLANPEAVQSLIAELDASNLDVDVLVNNAGLGEAELFERSPWSRIQEIIDVNILAMLRLTRQVLPSMISRGHGAILNIGSGAGYAAMPNAAVYTASKHFVRAFTESLRAQLAGTGIVVSEAAPGPVETEFDTVAGISGGATPAQGVFRISAQECANDIVRQFEKGERVIFPGRNYRFMMKLQPLMPRALLVRPLARAAQNLRHG